MISPKAKIRELERRIGELEAKLFDEQTHRAAAVRAHAILSVGIREALQIEHYPDFYKMYGDGLYAEGVARFLGEEVEKLREQANATPNRKSSLRSQKEVTNLRKRRKANR